MPSACRGHCSYAKGEGEVSGRLSVGHQTEPRVSLGARQTTISHKRVAVQSPLARWDLAAFAQMVLTLPSQHPASEAKTRLVTAAESGGKAGETEVQRR